MKTGNVYLIYTQALARQSQPTETVVQDRMSYEWGEP